MRFKYFRTSALHAIVLYGNEAELKKIYGLLLLLRHLNDSQVSTTVRRQREPSIVRKTKHTFKRSTAIMSFRELRTFAETMRLLGYPRLISMESFRVPNVELVADILYWLVRRYDPSSEIVFEIEHETDRVTFFKQVCDAALAKGRIKLNIKKLYQADGYAVQEMLKLANILKAAMRARQEDDVDYTALQSQAAQRGNQDMKGLRQLCSDMTKEGSNLFFLVEQEISSRGQRQRVMTRATEVSHFESRLRDLLSTITTEVESLTKSVQNLSGDETSLEQKIENKKAQLERSQKRLKSLMNVRPAFMEEYEKHESELHSQFVTYLEQYRNVEYLEHQLAKFNKYEDELLAEQETKLRVMREKLRKEELKVLRGDNNEDSDMEGGGRGGDDGSSTSSDDEDDDDSDDGKQVGQARQAAAKAALMNQQRMDHSRGDSKRPRAASGRTRPAGAAAPTSSGGRDNGDSDDDEDDDDDSDDDDSLTIDDEDDDDDDDDEDSDDDDDDSDDEDEE